MENNSSKTKNKLVYVLVILMIAAVSFLGGQYLMHQDVLKIFNDKKETTNDEKNIPEKMTLEEALAFTQNSCNVSSFINQTSNNSTDIQKTIKDIDNNTKLFEVYYCNQNSFKETVTKQEVENMFIKIFGSSDAVNHGNIVCPICDYVMYYYDASKGLYTKNQKSHPGHGGFGDSALIYFHPIDFSLVNGKYELTVTRAYNEGEDVGPSTNLYAKPEDILKGTPIITASQITKNNRYYGVTYGSEAFGESVMWSDFFDTFYDDIKDKLIPYKFTFTKENGVIKLVSYEKQ